ncbi:MAG TPA: hypothetical protein VKZ18_26690 [Polyangia bacterium]|nr:hypothetical protein [Polyangia bacterium]
MGLVLVSASMIASCGGGSSKPPPGMGCALNSDCASGLICTFGLCHSACVVNSDCPSSPTQQLCVKTSTPGNDGGTVNVCQLPFESKCVYNSDCKSPLVCARDEQCRNQCQTTVDCISPQVCTSSNVCALPSQLAPGTTDVPVVTNAGGAGGAPGTGGSGTGTGGTGTGTGGTGTGTGGSASTGGAGGGTAGSTGTGGAAGATGKGGAGGSNTNCSPGCGPGTQCVSGVCQNCGAANQVCCGTTCNSNLTCSAGMCSCGGKGQACCQATTCNTGLTCVSSACTCGGAGQPCCPSDNSCSTGLVCGGLSCGCITGCDGSSVLKPDNSVWTGSPLTKLTNSDGSAFIAVSISTNSYFSCGVKSDGTVWCWGSNGYGNLGGGSSISTSATAMYPVQVVTNSTATTPLTGISSVVVADTSYTACAIASTTGAVWCWGYGAQGQIGNGYTYNYAYATPVTTDATSGTQFTGAKQISVGPYDVCLVKTDMTVWCWGENTYGQVGNGTTGNPTGSPGVVNPTQVANLQSTGTSVAVLSNYNVCASTVDGGAWCWGYAGYNYLGNTTYTTTQNQPVQVMISAGATAPLTGVKQVLDFTQVGSAACALKTDGTLWCWPGSSPALYAVPYTNSSNMPVTSVTTIGRGCYLDANDKLWSGRYAGGTLTCP